jgi:hypothetical protein
MRLGLALGLPIPVGVPLECEGRRAWASLRIGREQLPKATFRDIASILDDDRLACGIILFDSWIVNQDRWAKNISRDRRSGKTFIFDHGRAFGAGHFGELEKNKHNIGIDHHAHCLCGITNLQWFGHWHQRIMEIPSSFIDDSFNFAVNEGMSREHANHLCMYLLERRRRLPRIFRDGRRCHFPHLSFGLFDPFAERMHYL